MAEEKETKKADQKENKEEKKETKKLDDLKNTPENKAKMAEIEGKTEEKKDDSKKEKKKSGNKKEEKKPELVREYVVPLRRGFIKVPEYKKAKKAVKTLKEFIAKHMKVEERDLKKVKIDRHLNNEIWHRGIRKPLNKVKVIAEKKEGIVYVKLADVPEVVKFRMAREEKKKEKVDKKAMKQVKKQEAAEEEIKEGREDNQDKEASKEKEKAAAETKEISQEKAAKSMKQTTNAKPKKVESGVTQRKALKK